jgi:hypothetical protein
MKASERGNQGRVGISASLRLYSYVLPAETLQTRFFSAHKTHKIFCTKVVTTFPPAWSLMQHFAYMYDCLLPLEWTELDNKHASYFLGGVDRIFNYHWKIFDLKRVKHTWRHATGLAAIWRLCGTHAANSRHFCYYQSQGLGSIEHFVPIRIPFHQRMLYRSIGLPKISVRLYSFPTIHSFRLEFCLHGSRSVLSQLLIVLGTTFSKIAYHGYQNEPLAVKSSISLETQHILTQIKWICQPVNFTGPQRGDCQQAEAHRILGDTKGYSDWWSLCNFTKLKKPA